MNNKMALSAEVKRLTALQLQALHAAKNMGFSSEGQVDTGQQSTFQHVMAFQNSITTRLQSCPSLVWAY
jgi:hypothetical protein